LQDMWVEWWGRSLTELVTDRDYGYKGIVLEDRTGNGSCVYTESNVKYPK
jgi:hypothetical protein